MPFAFFKKIKKNYFVLIIFAILIALFYSNTLMNGFVLDDRMIIEENIYIHSLRYLPKIVTGCIWEYALGGCKGTTLHYRPIHTLSYILTYQISKSAWFFHLINLVYFLIVAFLVFTLAKTITQNFILSFFAGLIFLIHPINNEVVAWIAAVSELTFSIFALLTIIFYIKYRETGLNKNFLLTLLFYFLSILSKETSMLLPFVLISIDLLFYQTKIQELFSWSEGELKKYLSFVFPVIIYLLMRIGVLGGLGGLTQKESYLGAFSFSERIYYFFWLFQRYLSKLFNPYPLIFYHEFVEEAVLFSPRFIIFLAIFLLFCTILYFAIKKNKNLIAFSLIWFFIFLLPVVFFYNIAGENIFAERYLFVLTIAFALAIAYILNYFWRKHKVFKIIISILLLVLVGASWLVIYPRNKIWKDNITFFRATLDLNPNAHPIREYLADEFLRMGDVEAARIEFEEIIARNPDWKYISHAYNNLGDYYRKKGNSERAEEYYKKAVETAPKIRNYKPYNNLGAFYFDKNEHLKALIYFCKASQIAPEAPEPKNNFGRIASIIESVSTEDFMFLYMDFMQGGAFEKSGEKKIQYRNKVCIANSCFYIFVPQLEEQETLLPFLIMAQGFPSEIIQIKNSFFSEEASVMVVNVDERYKDKIITFSFPTCDGVYYEVTATP